MKKVAIIMLILIIASNALAMGTVTSYAIKKINSAAAYMAANGTITMPAYATAGNAGKWIGLNLPPVRTAKVVTAILSVGAVLATDYAFNKLKDYAESKGWGYDDAGKYGPVTKTYEMADSGAIYAYAWTAQNGVPCTLIGVFETSDKAKAVLEAVPDTEGNYYQYGSTWCNAGYQDTAPARWDQNKVRGVYRVCYSNPQRTVKKNVIVGAYPYNGAAIVEKDKIVSTPTEAQKTALQNAVAVDLGNGGANGSNGAATEGYLISQDILQNPAGKAAQSSIAQTIINELEAAIDQAQKDTLDAIKNTQTADEYADQVGDRDMTAPMAGALSPSDVKNAVIDALLARGLGKTEVQDAIDAALKANGDLFGPAAPGTTPEELQQAIINALENQGLGKADLTDAVKDAFEDPSVAEPAPPIFTNPEKMSLTSILNSFMSSINNLPIITTLRGIALTASGSPVICLNLPANYGGQRCWNAASIQDELNNAGSAILAVVGMISFIGIFKG